MYAIVGGYVAVSVGRDLYLVLGEVMFFRFSHVGTGLLFGVDCDHLCVIDSFLGLCAVHVTYHVFCYLH